MIESLLENFRGKDITRGTKVLTAATAVRWAGWGFAENLVPIFLFSFSASYAEAGLLKSSYDIAMILSLPIIGIFADRIRPTTLILLGLALYVIVGTSYLLAGITGIALFVIIARLFNGVGFGLDAIGRETYFRRHNRPEKLATVFGYFDSVAIFWWIASALIGIFLVKHFALHWLLFMIVPTVMISFSIIWAWRKNGEESANLVVDKKINYRDLFKELGMWNYKLKLILLLNLILSASWSIIIFFLPIEMFIEGASYTTIILFGVATMLPVMFGMFLGRIFDWKGPRIFAYGLLLYGMLLILIGFGGSYVFLIVTAFLIGIIQEFVAVGREELVTMNSRPEHFGRVGGLMRSIMNIGAMMGPLIAGITIDATGSMRIVFMGLAGCMLLLAFAFSVFGRAKHLQKTKAVVAGI
ncbi:MAG TPA: MFS transporter [Candidatus Paceibacterota bacterium]|nr:MFS transporter [Candidatus Paceibacterota bacterium]